MLIGMLVMMTGVAIGMPFVLYGLHPLLGALAAANVVIMIAIYHFYL